MLTFSLRLLGLDILTVEINTDPPSDDDKARDLSGGTTASAPAGFVAKLDRPDEADLPDRW